MRIIPKPEDSGERLDRFLTRAMPEQSRSRIQEWIKDERVLVDGAVQRASYVIRGSEAIDVSPAAPPQLRAVAEDIELQILYEDGDLVAKNDVAHRHLAHQFASRQVKKTYLAMVHGKVGTERGRIEKPIARDPKRRERMTAKLASGRAAWSEFLVLERFARHTFLQVLIGTGRTHQIRVHLSSIGHPVVGDQLYGTAEAGLPRYYLHAHRIEFQQPSTGDAIALSSPLPPELAEWKAALAPLSGSQKQS